MAIEGRLEHRRIDTSSESVTPDEDWAAKNTAPTFGEDLAAGDIRPTGLRGSPPVVWIKSYDGMADAADPVADSTATLTVELVTFHRNRGRWVPVGGTELELAVNKRAVEFNLPLEDNFAIRVKSGTVAVADKALWIFVSTNTTEG